MSGANVHLQAWNYWDEAHPGHCNNINAQSWASAILNICLDLVVVGLPMPLLWQMNLNTRKKILVMLMFGELFDQACIESPDLLLTFNQFFRRWILRYHCQYLATPALGCLWRLQEPHP